MKSLDSGATGIWLPVPEANVDVLDRTRIFARGSAPAPIGLTPTIEREVFQLARRVALQADLPAAISILRLGLVRLADAADAACIFFDPASPNVPGHGARLVAGTTLVEPVGPAPARAVLVLQRPPTHAPFGAFEVTLVAAIATAIAGILGHFLAQHIAAEDQAARDAKTPFRPEVLAERRRAVALPGRVIATPRTWIRWAFPTLVGLVTTAIVAAALVQVPTYSTGIAIVTVEGEQITAPMPGTVAEVLVAPSSHVRAGDPLVRLRGVDEEAENAAAESEYRSALAMFLATPGDDGARNALAAIATRRQRARAAVDARTLRATSDGVVGDVRAHVGQLVAPGAQILKVSRADAVPAVVALLPGFDRPRLAVGMTVQVDLPGYRKQRETAVIDAIGTQVIGPEEARRSLGDPIGDALPISGPVVIVHAHLATRTFQAEGQELEFHDGMLGKAEVRVSRKSLLRALFPGSDS